MPEGFINNTRLKHIPLSSMTKPTGGGVTSVTLPQTGILQGIHVPVSVTLSGTLSNLNALGLASIIKRIQVKVNSGHTIYDVSGAGIFYLLKEMIQENYQVPAYSDALLAVSTGTKVLDFYLPIALNNRDEIGLIMLQNVATFVTLSIEWEADTTVATGATITGTATPFITILEVPDNVKDYPDMSTIHQVQEEQIAVSAAGDFDHQISIGATLVGEYYLFSAGYTSAQLRVQQSNILATLTPAQHRLLYNFQTGRDLLLSGTAITGSNNRLFWDLAGSDGLGQLGSLRDFINTQALTNIFTRLTAVGAGTLYAVRRQILDIAG